MFRQGLADRLAASGARFRALSTASKISLLFLVFVALVAVFAPWVATHDPLEVIARMRAPSAEYWFGTDRLGRDIFSRIVYGAQTSLFIGLGAVACAILFGSVLGATAATSDKWGNEIIMRLMDILMAFPGIALAAVLLATFGNSVPVIIITIAVVYTPQLARVVRANVVSQWDEDYVRAERVIGGSRTYILLKHVVRNTAAPVLVFATVMVADAIVFEASLSFLGAGVQPPHPSWGNILSEGRNIVLNGAWWATTFAGVMILLTVLALNILAEGLTDALVNPRLKGGKKPEGKSDERLSTDVQEALAEGLAFRRFDEGMVSKMAERVYCLYRGKDQESILMQKNACHDFAEKKGWNIVGEEQEIGVSGYKVSTDDLVKLKRIRKAVEQGEFDILLVFMYDQLGRNLNETPFIAEWFTKKGIHVWSVYEGEIIDGVDAERMLDYIRFWQTDEAQKL